MPKRYQDYVSNGICPTCKSKPAKEGIVLCQQCWEKRMSPERKAKQRNLVAKYKENNRALGLCDRCKNPRLDGYSQCERCRNKALNKIKQLRDAVFEMYGNQCVCCGETRKEFLTIDHKNGGGNQERKNGFKIYHLRKRFLEQGVSPDFQLLCMNCNFSKGIHGYCPHDKEKQ